MEYTIVEYAPVHLLGLRECFAYLQEAEAKLEEDRRPPSEELTEKYLRHLFSEIQIKSGKIYVAEAKDTVCGFVALWKESDEANLITTLSSFAYISDIVVLPRFQRSGIAGALMEKAEAFARSLGVSHCKIGSLARNVAATRLYLKSGFRPHEVSLLKKIS